MSESTRPCLRNSYNDELKWGSSLDQVLKPRLMEESPNIPAARLRN